MGDFWDFLSQVVFIVKIELNSLNLFSVSDLASNYCNNACNAEKYHTSHYIDINHF